MFTALLAFLIVSIIRKSICGNQIKDLEVEINNNPENTELITQKEAKEKDFAKLQKNVKTCSIILIIFGVLFTALILIGIFAGE